MNEFKQFLVLLCINLSWANFCISLTRVLGISIFKTLLWRNLFNRTSSEHILTNSSSDKITYSRLIKFTLCIVTCTHTPWVLHMEVLHYIYHHAFKNNWTPLQDNSQQISDNFWHPFSRRRKCWSKNSNSKSPTMLITDLSWKTVVVPENIVDYLHLTNQYAQTRPS